MARRRPKPDRRVSLTRTQRRLRAEIEEIASIANMDHWNILNYEEERRTPQLELMKDQLVRGEIIVTYTFIDELLSDIIVNKYFRGPDKQSNGFGARKSSKPSVIMYSTACIFSARCASYMTLGQSPKNIVTPSID